MPWDFGHEEKDPPIWHDHPLNKYRRRRVDGHLKDFYRRYEWWAKPPESSERLNNHAPPFMGWRPADMANHVHFTHTATKDCEEFEPCMYVLRDLQIEHMNQGEPDIRHSFMISKDGLIFEGRGWDTMCNIPEDFTTFYTASLEIALIGDFSKSKPPKTAIQAVKRLTEWGIVNKKLYCCYDKTYNYDLYNQYFGKCA